MTFLSCRPATVAVLELIVPSSAPGVSRPHPLLGRHAWTRYLSSYKKKLCVELVESMAGDQMVTHNVRLDSLLDDSSLSTSDGLDR